MVRTRAREQKWAGRAGQVATLGMAGFPAAARDALEAGELPVGMLWEQDNNKKGGPQIKEKKWLE